MGVVVLQMGQGGNQFGFSFFEAMNRFSPMAAVNLDFFRDAANSVPTARCVLIDTEPKAIGAMVKNANLTGRWKYGTNIFTKDSGSGNNWACGFCNHGPACKDAILDLIHHEVEACDDFAGFIIVQSLAGGTGAGLGAYLAELLKDEFPEACIMSLCIWPYRSGEVVVQNYNMLLTLATLQDCSDGIIIAENEVLGITCKRALGILRPSFEDMNDVGAQSLASILEPAQWRPLQGCLPQTSSQPSVPHVHGGSVRLLSDLLSTVCAHPAYRILSLYSTPQISGKSLEFTSFTWSSQLKQLRRGLFTSGLMQDESLSMFLANSGTMRDSGKSMNHCVANMLVLRGKNSAIADISIFQDPDMYAAWSIEPLKVACSNSSFGKQDMVVGLLSNCQSTVLPAAGMLSHAYAMYSSKAYLHQYFQYGLDEAAFESAFATIEDVLFRYLTLI